MTSGKCPKIHTVGGVGEDMLPIIRYGSYNKCEATCFVSPVPARPSLRQNYVLSGSEQGN